MRGVNILIESLTARRAPRGRTANAPESAAAGPTPQALAPAVPAARPEAIHLAFTPASATPPGAPGLAELLAEGRHGVEFQPVVEAAGLEIHGWEALARFRDGQGTALSPDRVFAALHDSPPALFQAEQAVKRLQIALAPRGGRLFLNLDPDAWAAGGAAAFLPLLTQARPDGMVVEIVENTSRRDIALSARMARELERAGIAVALDDVGADGALFSYSALDGAAYLKLDRFWLSGSPVELARKAPMSQGLIATAGHFGVAAVVEGVETHADLETARALGARYVQGRLFETDFQRRWA